MFNRTFRVGTRTSPLALRQVDEVSGYLRKFYPDIEIEVVGIDTYGDKDRITPISDIEGTDFFTREIDIALLRGEIDFSVHSAKDLPDRIPSGLYIAAITESIDYYDALVSKNNLILEQLSYGARIGVSSQRRRMQLEAYRNDFQIADIRGNIQERLKILTETDLDALVIAACALLRLGLGHRITQKIPFEILKPHPLQGALAVVTRKEDSDLIKLIANIDTRKVITV